MNLESELARLPEPTPPPEIAATVAARIAQLESAPPPARPLPRRRKRFALSAALAGVVAGVAAVSSHFLSTASALDLISPRIGTQAAVVTMPDTAPAVIGAGLLLYLTGFIALGANVATKPESEPRPSVSGRQS